MAAAFVAGFASMLVGWLLLTTWEPVFFGLNTFDHDVTGLQCGTPLSNPGWETGSPCHGAVNRQLGVGVMFLLAGLATTAMVVAVAVKRRRHDPA